MNTKGLVVGKEYMIFNPKEKIGNEGKREISFGIGNNYYDKEAKAWKTESFLNVTAKTNQRLSNKDKVTISKILSANPTIYFSQREQKQVPSGFFTVELKGEGEVTEQQNNYEAVSSDDLPF